MRLQASVTARGSLCCLEVQREDFAILRKYCAKQLQACRMQYPAAVEARRSTLPGRAPARFLASVRTCARSSPPRAEHRVRAPQTP